MMVYLLVYFLSMMNLWSLSMMNLWSLSIPTLKDGERMS